MSHTESPMSASRALNWAGLLMSRMVFMFSSEQLMILILCMGHRRQRQSSWTRSARKLHEELSWCVFCCAWVSWCAPACLGTELECCPEQIFRKGSFKCRIDSWSADATITHYSWKVHKAQHASSRKSLAVGKVLAEFGRRGKLFAVITIIAGTASRKKKSSRN